MFLRRRPKRATRVVLAFLLLALIGLPTLPASAALRVEIPLADDGNADFARGKFGMTGLVPPSPPRAPKGGVQLLTLGTLQNVRSGLPPLCVPLAGMGTATYRTTVDGVETTYMYAIGGKTSLGAEYLKTCYTRIINGEGMTETWTEDDSLLPVGLTEHGVVSLQTSNGAYLYVLGGASGTDQLSQAKIYRATINPADGSISNWAEQQLTLPVGEGRHSFALTSYRTESGENYLYMFGGQRRYTFMGNYADVYKRDAYRVQIDGSGNFVGDWEQLGDIPIIDELPVCAGLVGSKAAQFPVFQEQPDGSTLVTETVYLVGGQYKGRGTCAVSSQPSADVYRASLHPTTGDLIWESNPSLPAGDPEYNIFTLPNPLYGHVAVGFNQKIYVLGGWNPQRVPAGPEKRVYGSFADPERDLVYLNDCNCNFVQSAEVIPKSLYSHNGVVAWYDNMPMLYILGGRDSAETASDDYTDTVYYSIPSIDEDTGSEYAGEGAFYSHVYDLERPTTPVELTWTGVITDDATDIRMAYRMADSVSFLYSKPWTILDAVPSDDTRWSASGGITITNSAELPAPETGRYLQYKAVLISNQGTRSPILTGVSMIVEYDSFPNIKTQDVSMPGLQEGPTVTLVNTPPEGSTKPVVDADVGDREGWFFVDMYFFEPGEEVVTPTLTVQGAEPQGEVYAMVPKWSLPADGSATIPPGNWFNSSDDQQGVNWGSYINRPGVWNILIVVDSHDYNGMGGAGLVPEGDQLTSPGEQDNVFRFTFENQRAYMQLPLVVR